ncbi:MAG: glucose 1-dehydrogenase [Chloroflexota bacterium]
MKFGLKDKVAIVTGAGQGIGEAIARTLATAGAFVSVNDINPDRAARVANEINDSGGKAVAIAADVANKFQCVHLIETTRDEWGQLDILVNNAGIMPHASILKMDEWDFNRCFEVNLKGTFFMSQLCGRVMSDENQGRGGAIVNIASVAGNQIALDGRAAYCANSAGIVGFAKACAQEFAPFNIRVNTILAGLIETAMTTNEPQEKTAVIPLKRFGLADEVAQTALFLCADASGYVTGTTVTVDGGQVLT